MLSTVPSTMSGHPTYFNATLTDISNGGAPVSGKTIIFNGTGVIPSPLSVTTNSRGKAAATGTSPSTVATGWTYEAHFAGDNFYKSIRSVMKTYNTSRSITPLPLLTIDKDISTNNFTWTDIVRITLNVENEGNGTSHNIFVKDYYPAGFNVLKNNTITVNKSAVSFTKPTLAPGESYTVSYSMVGQEGMSGNTQITLVPAELTYVDGTGNQFLKKSHELTIFVSSPEFQNIANIALLSIASSSFGAAAAGINWRSMDTKQREGERRSGYILSGAIAGILVLATFEGLSNLFSGSALKANPQTIITLLGTSAAAGFAPRAVINQATQRWKETAKGAEVTARVNKIAAEQVATDHDKALGDIRVLKGTARVKQIAAEQVATDHDKALGDIRVLKGTARVNKIAAEQVATDHDKALGDIRVLRKTNIDLELKGEKDKTQ